MSNSRDVDKLHIFKLMCMLMESKMTMMEEESDHLQDVSAKTCVGVVMIALGTDQSHLVVVVDGLARRVEKKGF